MLEKEQSVYTRCSPPDQNVVPLAVAEAEYAQVRRLLIGMGENFVNQAGYLRSPDELVQVVSCL